MKKIKDFFNVVLEKFLKVVNTKSMIAIKDGFILTMPVTLVGSLFLLVAEFPLPAWGELMASIFGAGWKEPFYQVSGSTFDVLAIVAVIAISYTYAKNEKVNGFNSAILSFVSFLIVTDSFKMTEAGESIGGVIPKNWTGGNGVITAILVAIITAKIFAFFLKRNITIKMPETVPAGVTSAFSALIPGLVIMAGSMIIFILSNKFAGVSLTELIFKVLQTPLQNLSDTLPGGLIMTFIMSIMFWAGIHGPNIVMGIMGPILTANATANQEIVNAGKELVVGGNAKIMTIQLIDVYVKFGGQGITLGLLIAALLVAKSAQLKEISKLSVTPGIFNINEPVIYGLPIVFNPVLLVPFVLVPIVGVLICYFAIRIGFMPPFQAATVPWTTPVLVSGFLLGGVKGVIVQLLILAESVLIYLPFVKKLDSMYHSEEMANK
ncbi:PTS sugar transporter subunit IIC [Vagococcus sp. BWB3-3]|uniref:Permease IIC component n=1 Tax=Vagococcus allomyrinae TaxID=2794353 RepID=A0A940PB52_9ENTE|nr:PTS sugar transporter subunit IIC [Vagococcus allomyrinae]MBP1040206.1 PTS sugar transporter subunit IIC [Vagococcus allomyrinae]